MKLRLLIILHTIFISSFLFASTKKNLPDSLNYYFITKISIEGNKKTKDRVIIHELTFSYGDTINIKNISLQIEKSQQNLHKTKLFNFVTINYEIINYNSLIISIKVEERWYLWPQIGVAYADRNFSAWLKHKDFKRIVYGIALEKYNFRGLKEKIRFKIYFGFENEFAFFLRQYLS